MFALSRLKLDLMTFYNIIHNNADVCELFLISWIRILLYSCGHS